MADCGCGEALGDLPVFARGVPEGRLSGDMSGGTPGGTPRETARAEREGTVADVLAGAVVWAVVVMECSGVVYMQSPLLVAAGGLFVASTGKVPSMLHVASPFP